MSRWAFVRCLAPKEAVEKAAERLEIEERGAPEAAAYSRYVRTYGEPVTMRSRCTAAFSTASKPAELPAALAEGLMALSSAVALAPDGVWLEVSGSLRLFGGVQGLAERTREIARLLTQVVSVTVADRPATARVVSRADLRPVITVEPGGDRAALAPLPLETLEASARALTYLTRLGLQTVGDLARLEPPALRRRLGDEGARLVRLARADVLPLPERYSPPDQPVAQREFEPPIPPSEAVLFIVKTVLDELTTRLTGRGLSIAELALTLTFEGGAVRREELLLPRPLRTTAPLLATLQERLLSGPDGNGSDPGARDWPARLTLLSVQALRTASAPPGQLSLFSREEADTEELATLLARLTGTLGRERVFAAELTPTHRPESTWRRTDFAGLAPPTRAATKKIHDHDVKEPPTQRPIFVLPQPRLVAGSLLPGSDLSWEGGSGCVCSSWGPERLRGQWWSTPFDRDYYVVDLEGGARLWVYWDRSSEELYLQGIFD